MKKIITAAIIILGSAKLNAQSLYVQGGLNFANITETNNGGTEDNHTLTTFNAGIMGRLGLSKVVDVESGLLLTGRGSKAEYDYGTNNYVKAKFNPLYVELPVNLLLKFPLAGKTNFFVNAGPYVAVGVGGKSKQETRVGNVITTTSTDIKFDNNDPFSSQQDDASYDELKRFDYGINVGGGVTLRGVILKLNYGIGLEKINATETNNSANDKNKYRTWSFSVGIPLRG